MHDTQHDMSQHKDRIDIYLDIPSNTFSQSNFITCLMADKKLIEAVCCFRCLWQVSKKSYKDVRRRENT